MCGSEFQSTRPVRGATPELDQNKHRVLFQSTRPVRGATLLCSCGHPLYGISIHAPRAGRDSDCVAVDTHVECISIHAPRAGRDCRRFSSRRNTDNFNPRAPCGARRTHWSTMTASQPNFNPRAPCGARQRVRERLHVRIGISIHAPRAGRDPGAGSEQAPGPISIHAPRAGRDSAVLMRSPPLRDFNPRAPCGARL